MLEDDRKAIKECLYVINHIFEYTEGITDLEDLINDSKTYDAVLMNFLVLGESSSKLSTELRDKMPKTDWRAIKGFRNFIAHQYFGVDENILWSALHFHLPQLKQDFETLLAQHS